MNHHLTRVIAHPASRRTVLAGALGALGGAALSGRVAAQAESTPAAGEAAPYLFVADAAAQAVALYSIPGFELTGQLDGVTFGIHGGALQLPDGRLLFADVGSNEILALGTDDAGAPVILQRTAATLGGGISWASVDPEFTYLVAGSLVGEHEEQEHTQYINIVDLETFDNVALEFTMNEPEEITPWLMGDPLHLHVATGGEIASYLLADLLEGRQEPLAKVPVDLESHGGATDAQRGHILYVTGPGAGFDVLDVSDGAAAYLTQVPWDLDDLSGGRNARPRMLPDGDHIFGVMTPGLDDHSLWAETMVSNHILNLETLEARRVPVDVGTIGYRWGVSDRYALWAGYNAEGAQAYLLDADPASATFGDVVATIPVAMPSQAAQAGEDYDGSEFYLMTAITPDSAYGFVTISGDSLIQVLDLAAREVVAEITTPFPLAGGGYTTVVQPGLTPVDLWAR
ncbi:MAG: hypothetical protein KDM91_12740 [Verrucomicrobiae bacterium]|nr:hypothetical protein [Verrucomicrobiae bacterium]